MSFSNYHTHSRYCDGKDSPEELVLRALELGCPELGFSGHSYVPFDDCCMSREGTEAYKREIRALQEKYRDRIGLYLGVEQDFFSPLSTEDYDYVIGAVHYVYKDGAYLSVDTSRREQERIVAEHYGGDYYAMIEDYYALVGRVYEQTRCRIVAHFDLITKYNEDGDLFDSAHPRYRAAALGALEKLRDAPVIFEINTGAMARGARRSPYPESFLLRAMEAAGAELILSSDCHDKKDLLLGFSDLAGCAKKLRKSLF